ncbi:MAG TPA: hypothetical protein VHC86_13130 [Opitutaceae bacterium]|nr:hypothetical protein [Opitutaceae bacterium]
MLQRLVTGNPQAICTVLAFAFAASIFFAMAWRALRMDRARSDRLARLPFDSSPETAHDQADHSAER